ncbi:MAG TPA: helix-hairpin-helix domain-containing protein, partial [Kofleriaceae bacterium]|nr:helix-hairpin-helix domain-containing protein [Kofleriaceae bacterium]
ASATARRGQSRDVEALLTKVQERLGLARVPRRIECFDIAHLQGSETVASMVTFVEGEPAKALYRKFKVRTVGNDDFAAMYEVLTRRFRRAAGPAALETEPETEPELATETNTETELEQETEPDPDTAVDPDADADAPTDADPDTSAGADAGAASKRAPGKRKDAAWEAPDLLVIDGGKGQLGMAMAALRDLGIALGERGVDVVGLAKERELESGDAPDRIYRPNVKDPVQLRPNSPELYLLARLRDEAHRFANSFHQQRRGKTALRSELEEIPGVGEARRRALLRHFGSVRAIRTATAEDLARCPGMTRAAAAAVRAFFDASGAAAGAEPAPTAPASPGKP